MILLYTNIISCFHIDIYKYYFLCTVIMSTRLDETSNMLIEELIGSIQPHKVWESVVNRVEKCGYEHVIVKVMSASDVAFVCSTMFLVLTGIIS